MTWRRSWCSASHSFGALDPVATARGVTWSFGSGSCAGKLSGKASLDQNLLELGIDLSDGERDLVLERVIELGDKKHIVTKDDLPYLLADVLKTPDDQLVKIEHYRVDVASDEPPRAQVALAQRFMAGMFADVKGEDGSNGQFGLWVEK